MRVLKGSVSTKNTRIKSEVEIESNKKSLTPSNSVKIMKKKVPNYFKNGKLDLRENYKARVKGSD